MLMPLPLPPEAGALVSAAPLLLPLLLHAESAIARPATANRALTRRNGEGRNELCIRHHTEAGAAGFSEASGEVRGGAEKH